MSTPDHASHYINIHYCDISEKPIRNIVKTRSAHMYKLQVSVAIILELKSKHVGTIFSQLLIEASHAFTNDFDSEKFTLPY